MIISKCCEAEVDRVEEVDGGGLWVCRRCGGTVGCWLDAGSLDLGLVRREVEADASDALVFTEDEAS